MLRNTTEAFSALVGGVNNLEISRFSKAYSGNENEDEFGRRQDRNVQLILKEESHLDKIIDPGAGSYYIEKLTEQFAEKILAEIKDIESAGGILECLKTGLIQKRIRNIADQRIKDLNIRKTAVVGTNIFADPKEELVMIKSREKDAGSAELPDDKVLEALEQLA